MCGIKSKNTLLLSAVLLFLLAGSFSAYSQDMGNEQADLTKAELSAMFQQMGSLEKANENLTNDYNELNQKYQTNLISHQDSLMKLEQKVKLMEIESQVRLEAFQRYESETIWTKIGLVSVGIIAGYAGNELKNDIVEDYRVEDSR